MQSVSAILVLSATLVNGTWIPQGPQQADQPSLPATAPKHEPSASQKEPSHEPDPFERALEILSFAESLIPSLPDPESQVTPYAALGDTLWSVQPERAKTAFRSAFMALAKIDVSRKPRDREDAKAQIQLKYWKENEKAQLLARVAQLDADFAKELSRIGRVSGDSADEDGRLTDEGIGLNFQRAFELLDSDPERAAEYAQRTLVGGVTPWFVEFLPALRQQSVELADQLFLMALGVVLQQGQPPDVTQLHLLGAYITSTSGSVNPALARQFLSVLAGALLAQADPGFQGQRRLSPGELLHLAQIYTPVFEFFTPELLPAIQVFQQQQAAAQPTRPTTQGGNTASPTDGESRLSSSEVAGAGGLLSPEGEGGKPPVSEEVILKIRDEKVRQTILDARKYNEAQAALQQEKVEDAARLARQIGDVLKRADLYLEMGKVLCQRGDTDQGVAFFDKSYQLASALDDLQAKPLHMLTLARAALDVDRDRALYYAQGGVTDLNRATTEESTKTFSIDRMIRRSGFRGHLDALLTPLAQADLSQAIYLATQLQDTGLRVLAQIAACRPALQKAPKKSEEIH